MQVRARQGDTVDALCFRHLGRTAGVVEQVLAANNGLAAFGAFLPLGTQVNLPDPVKAVLPTVTQTKLWD